MVALFTIAVFLAAALLFGVQPMVAKALLPQFGGGSSVWTTCMLFFQTLLIGGYLYAHLLLTRFPRRMQMVIHGGVLGLAFVLGWMFRDPSPPPTATEFPVPWLLGQLLLIAGPPYFAVSSAGPLLQGWFYRTNHARGADPYFLYAASNAGSFVGLLAYPFVIEPELRLSDQRSAWLIAFAVLSGLLLYCVSRTRPSHRDEFGNKPRSDDQAITWRRRLWWVFLAFVPSTTLLGVTTHLTTDVASFPLLWVMPLALYLLTMILAFSGRAATIVKSGVRPMVVAVIAAWVLLVAWEDTGGGVAMAANFAIQLALLGTVGLYGHSRLAVDRPHPRHLTEFYLLMSVGGALGGLFNGVVAPLIFSAPYEYHVALLMALLMIPGKSRPPESRALGFWARRLRLPAASVGIVLILGLVAPHVADPAIRLALLILPVSFIIFRGWRDRIACAGSLAVPLVVIAATVFFDPFMLYQHRTFYGVHRVGVGTMLGRKVHRLYHGTTVHGVQFYGDPELANVPLTYYHFQGPTGALFRTVQEMRPERARYCVIGLGSGGISVYGRPEDDMVYMEIDPAVAEIAANTEYFTYLRDAVCEIDVRLGDGRLLMERSRAADEPRFDLILADAFSSDSIPTHLLTVEAVRLYFDSVTEGGVVAMHISNRHVNLLHVLHAVATAEGAYPLMYDDPVPPEITAETARFSSMWVAMTKSKASGEALMSQGFRPYRSEVDTRPWTDQYSNLLGVLWKQ